MFSILASFAHPDDEAFGVGGSIARYAAAGVPVTLVCATRGEVGEISDPSLATPETLGEVREAELRCAANSIGVQELIFLGYRDSGMDGSAENQDPRAFINQPAATVVRQLVAILRQQRPDVVVTFEPFGGYGHPDHIAIHKHTVAAFHAAGNTDYAPELGASWQAQRLFYTAIPRSFFLSMKKMLDEAGQDTREFERFERNEAGWPDDQVNVTLDVRQAVEAKWDALECHRTQFGPGNLFRRLPDEQVKQLMSQEHFALAWPVPSPGARLPDLLSGLNT
jgi:LmbE family N-acetylglucosaminyl deacetylase